MNIRRNRKTKVIERLYLLSSLKVQLLLIKYQNTKINLAHKEFENNFLKYSIK